MNATFNTAKPPRLLPGTVLSRNLATVAGARVRFWALRDTATAPVAHEDSSECFFVLTGVVHIDHELGTVTLRPGEFHEVPAGLWHLVRVQGEATLLVFDSVSV